MLTFEERIAILDALREWVEFTPAEQMFGFIESGILMTPKEILREIEERTSDGVALMEIIEYGVSRIGLDATVERLRARPDTEPEPERKAGFM